MVIRRARRRYAPLAPQREVDPKHPGKILPTTAPTETSTMKPWQSWLEVGVLCTSREDWVLLADRNIGYEGKEQLYGQYCASASDFAFFITGAGRALPRVFHGDICVYLGEYARIKVRDPFSKRIDMKVHHLFLTPRGAFLAAPDCFVPLESEEKSQTGV